VAFFRPRCGKWQAIVTRKGYKPLSKTFISKIDAEKWARSIEIQFDRGTFQNTPNPHLYSFSDLIDIYIKKVLPTLRSKDAESYRLRRLQRHPIASINLSKLTPIIISSYRDERLKLCKSGTVIRELSNISTILNYGKRELGLTINNPVTLIKKPPIPEGRNRILKEDEISRLLIELEKINPWYKFLTEFALETAMRRGELMSFLWTNVDFEKHLIFLPITKNGYSRYVPLSNRAINILKLLPKTKEERVFPLNKGTVSAMFLEAVRRAKLDNVHFHDLRHIAITNISKKIPNIFELAIISGHRSLKMLQRYTHIKAEDVANKMN
jgi:integrase